VVEDATRPALSRLNSIPLVVVKDVSSSFRGSMRGECGSLFIVPEPGVKKGKLLRPVDHLCLDGWCLSGPKQGDAELKFQSRKTFLTAHCSIFGLGILPNHDRRRRDIVARVETIRAKGGTKSQGGRNISLNDQTSCLDHPILQGAFCTDSGGCMGSTAYRGESQRI
jgi:hypothetical protein